MAEAQQDTTLDLWRAVLSLETVDDCRRFFADLCTPAEIRAMSDRWLAARMVNQGIPYRQIYEQAGISTATVTRVARCVSHGEGGYRRVLDRMAKW